VSEGANRKLPERSTLIIISSMHQSCA